MRRLFVRLVDDAPQSLLDGGSCGRGAKRGLRRGDERIVELDGGSADYVLIIS